MAPSINYVTLEGGEGVETSVTDCYRGEGGCRAAGNVTLVLKSPPDGAVHIIFFVLFRLLFSPATLKLPSLNLFLIVFPSSFCVYS